MSPISPFPGKKRTSPWRQQRVCHKCALRIDKATHAWQWPKQSAQISGTGCWIGWGWFKDFVYTQVMQDFGHCWVAVPDCVGTADALLEASTTCAIVCSSSIWFMTFTHTHKYAWLYDVCVCMYVCITYIYIHIYNTHMYRIVITIIIIIIVTIIMIINIYIYVCMYM